MREIILALMFWISAQTGYEVNTDPPRLVFLSPSQVVDICIDEGTLIPYAAESCYKLHKHAIYLRDDFNIYRADQAGTLVHELTHVLQLSNGLDYNLSTMDALESEADRMEKRYESSRGIQIKVRNLAQGRSRVVQKPQRPITAGYRHYEEPAVGYGKNDYAADSLGDLLADRTYIGRKIEAAAGSDARDRYFPYQRFEYDSEKPVVGSRLEQKIYERLRPVEPMDSPEPKKRVSRPSPLKREILIRLGKYRPRKPENLQNRIMKKMNRDRYPNEVSAAKPAPHTTPNRFYILVLPGDTVSGLAGIYGVSANAIRDINGIRGETVTPGQKLLIP